MNIITLRLVLRDMRISDLDVIYSMYTNVEVHRYEPIGMLSKDELRFKIQEDIERTSKDPRKPTRFIMTFPGEDQMIGSLQLTLNNESIREWEIGWSLLPVYWGQGLAPEAAREVLHYAFVEFKAHRVVAFCHADNHPSTRVMEKIGMQHEGRLRKTRWLHGQWWDEYVYGILEGE